MHKGIEYANNSHVKGHAASWPCWNTDSNDCRVVVVFESVKCDDNHLHTVVGIMVVLCGRKYSRYRQR